MKRVALAAVAFTMACTSVKPVAIQAGDVCARCRQTITATRLAAETIDRSGGVQKYRTVKCLATYLVERSEEPLKQVFVTDYASGDLLSARNAMFVWATIDKTTGEQDYLAFKEIAGAVAAGKAHRQAPIDWLQVMSRTDASANGDH